MFVEDSSQPIIASIDQGTQSTRVALYDSNLVLLAFAQKSHRQFYPKIGWVEHDPSELLENIRSLLVEVSFKLKQTLHSQTECVIKCLGITNQRETCIAWDKDNGKPLYNAIVWLDTRTKDIVDEIIVKTGGVDALREQSGLPIATYFSATKMKWLIDNVPEVQDAVHRKSCYFGTIDTWIIWNLTGGPGRGIYVTDITNASRTLLMDISACQWSPYLLSLFNIPCECLPTIVSSAEHYGSILDCGCFMFEGVSISGCIGDQQASCLGQGIFSSGQVKCTYGTGAFILLNTGQNIIRSTKGLITTPCYQIGNQSPVCYAVEGSVAVAGAAISWLKDNLGIISEADETEALITSVPNTAGTYFVPAFSGLFAPRWRQDARGCIVGLTQHTKKAHIVRALMESIGFQMHEIVEAMLNDMQLEKLNVIRVGGGMSQNNAFLQLIANLCGCVIERPENADATVIGAAIAAGLGIGIWSNTDIVESHLKSSFRRWYPEIDESERTRKIINWNKAVEKSLNWV